MTENVVSKIRNLPSDTLDDYVKEYKENARAGKYHTEDNLFPYHLSDVIFLHDNSYHYPYCNEGKKIKTKIRNAIDGDALAVLASIFVVIAVFISTFSIVNLIISFLPNSIEWVSVPMYIAFCIFFSPLFFELCVLTSKEIDLFSLTALNVGKTHRLKNISMVQPQKDMPEKITAIHSQFSSTMEELLSNTPQALSNAGWDLLISSYENYTSLYVFLAEKNGIISDELMDSYATKLEKRYKKFSSIAQDVINTTQKYQIYLDKEESNTTQLKQYMIDSDALRAIPLEEDSL